MPKNLTTDRLKKNLLPVRPTMRHYKIRSGFRKRTAHFTGKSFEFEPPSLVRRLTSWSKKRPKHSVLSGYESVSGHAPIIWIEVRNNHRVWLNQVTGIKTLVDRLKISHPHAAIFLAGWSRPLNPTLHDKEQIELDTRFMNRSGNMLRAKFLL